MGRRAKPKSVLLLGGTGAMGIYLAPLLRDSGYDVFVTTRSSNYKNSNDIRYITGDAHDVDFLDKTLSVGKYDAIVDFMIYSTEQFHQLFDIIASCTSHYIYTSSYRVYADSGTKPLDELSPRLLDTTKDKEYLTTDEYALAKARQEDIIRDSSYTNWTIIRPGITYSTGRLQLGTQELEQFGFRAINHKPTILPSGMMEKQTTMTWAGDVAQMICELILNQKALKGTFNVATAEHHSWSDVSKIYHDEIGLEVVECELHSYIEALGGEYQVKYDRMFDRIIDNSKILSITNTEQSQLTKLQEGLRYELDASKHSEKLGAINYAQQAKIDAITGTHIPLSNATDEEVFNYLQFNPTRICISTLSGYENYGAILQNYALQEAIKEISRLPIVTLDAPRSESNRVSKKVALESLIRAPLRTVKQVPLYVQGKPTKGVFGELGKAISYGMATRNQLKFLHANIQHAHNTQAGDIIVVGSDQVWNPYHNRTGFFWMDEKPNIRISYAASFGDIDTKDINLGYRRQIRKALHKFTAISVREKTGQEIVKEYAGLHSTVVCDPTLLLMRSKYEEVLGPTEDHTSDYWLGYMIASPEAEKEVRSLSDKLGTKFVNHNMYHRIFSNPLVWDGHIVRSNYPTVEKWLRQVRNAELVVTSSFHAIVFSMIFHTDFVYITKDMQNPSQRIVELLKLTHTNDRMLESIDGIVSVKPIDWGTVEKQLSKLRDKSFSWLKSTINGL